MDDGEDWLAGSLAGVSVPDWSHPLAVALLGADCSRPCGPPPVSPESRSAGAARRRLRPTGQAHDDRIGRLRLKEEEAVARPPVASARRSRGTPQHGTEQAITEGPGGLPTLRVPVGPAGRDVGEGAAGAPTSAFVGVSWHKQSGQWRAQICHSGKVHHLGSYVDEHEAAKTFDAAARRLRPTGQAHGVQSGPDHRWLRLNFATAEEETFAAQREMPPKKKLKSGAVPTVQELTEEQMALQATLQKVQKLQQQAPKDRPAELSAAAAAAQPEAAAVPASAPVAGAAAETGAMLPHHASISCIDHMFS